jgi:uncharacterized membrane protein YozB (DUF420 family)
MDYYQLVATINLIVQVAVLVLLMGGYWLKRIQKFRQHGITMLAAVILHIITVLAVMLPSFVLGVIPLIFDGASFALAMVASFHGIMGIIAAVLGVWIVTSWRLRASLQYCGGSAPKKKLMRLTLILWVIALLLGILLYLHFYTTILPLQ